MESIADTTGEEGLLRRSRAGDLDAFSRLVEIHTDRVCAALRSFGLTAGEAEDVAQEVFLRAWRGLGKFQGRAQLSTWLYRIAHNEAQRRLAHRPPAPVSQPGLDGGDPILRLAAPESASPEARALDHEFAAMLQTALAQLPEAWRVAVVLRDIEGFSTEEAAAVAGIGEAAFKSRLHRGRMQLRAALEPYLTAP